MFAQFLFSLSSFQILKFDRNKWQKLTVLRTNNQDSQKHAFLEIS